MNVGVGGGGGGSGRDARDVGGVNGGGAGVNGGEFRKRSDSAASSSDKDPAAAAAAAAASGENAAASVGCASVAACIYFLVTSSFAWMLMEGLSQYQSLYVVFSTREINKRFCALIGRRTGSECREI